MLWEFTPIRVRPSVVLGVVTIVEEQKVVQPTVVADRTSNVFVITLQKTESKTYQKARKIQPEEKLGRNKKHCGP
jgi:hypothetical protein